MRFAGCCDHGTNSPFFPFVFRFRRLLNSEPTSPNLKDFEIRVCQELHGNPEALGMISKIFRLAGSSAEGETRTIMRKNSSYEASALDFLEALFSNDLLLLALILDLVQFQNMSQVLTPLVFIFHDYNRMSRLVRFSVAHELVMVYKKWETRVE